MATGYPSIDRPWIGYYPEEAYHLVAPPLSLYGLIKEKNKDYLSGTALSYFDKTTTFKELFENTEKTAAAKAGGLFPVCDQIPGCTENLFPRRFLHNCNIIRTIII